MPRTEAYAYSAALCDKHVLPFWTCGVEECSLCQGVASMYSSSQSSAKWCSAFKLETIDNTTDSYARDLGRFYKCNYLTNYLSSTEDKHRLENREATTEEACTSRTFCSDTVNKLPKLDTCLLNCKIVVFRVWLCKPALVAQCWRKLVSDTRPLRKDYFVPLAMRFS